MIIFLHGSGEVGNGSQTALGNLENAPSGSIPYKIKNGTFPTSVTVDSQTFSFIVISPQFTKQNGIYSTGAIKAMIDTAIKYYRVDTNRIYVTGLSLGGAWGNVFVAYSQAAYTNQTAASVLICPSDITPTSYSFAARATQVGLSNLPLWILSNYGDANTPRADLQLYVDTLNLYSPQLMPKAKLNILDSSNLTPGTHHDAWTAAYNQANTWDGLNVYQWMLQFTNKKLSANAGPDQSVDTSSVTLNGARSKARQGNITDYLWTKLSGPSCTIVNNTDSITAVTGLSAGTYSFELKVTHSNASTARDTVQIIVTGAAQTLNKISKIIFREYSDNSISVGGYLESLPASYNTDSTRKFPMIVFVHDDKSFGTGSSADLAKITDSASGTIPNLIKDGTFPTSVTVNGKAYSFIVVCPQFKSESGISIGACIKAMIDTAIQHYRVDTSRIYVTGAGWGGYAANAFVATTSPSYINYIHQTAAAALICPLYTETGALTKAANQVGASNLPIRFFRNSADPHPYANIATLQLYIDTLNLYKPQLTDTARLTVFTASNHDAWTAAYNPANTWDSLNLYQWMLQYTNQKLTANAGADQSVATDSTILDATGSRARQGRISDYLWTKLSGPSCTITNNADSTTMVTGMSNGTYNFELKVTHANGSTARDTIVVTVNYTASTDPPASIPGAEGRIVLPDSTYTFDGSASRASLGNTITSYLWSKYSGPTGGNISNPDSAVTEVTGLRAGMYIFRLKVTDNHNRSSISEVFLYVFPSNQGPVSVPGRTGGEITLPTNSFTFNAYLSSAAPGNTIVSYLWTKRSGPGGGNISDPDSVITTMTGLQEGTYIYDLTVTDNNGNWSKWGTYIIVHAASPRKSNIEGNAASENISAQPAPLEVKAIPNPAGSDISIIINGNVKGKTSVTIYNVLGKRVLQQQFRKEDAGTINRNINISSLAAGIYIVEIAIDNEIRKTIKIVKH
jgi:predicted peptidase